MQNLKLLTILFLCPFLAVAQSNYKPGYVVKLSGDTAKGFIDYREWNGNPNSINFKSSLSDKKPVVYTPDLLKYFDIANLESYQRYQGPISMDVTDIYHLINGRDSSYNSSTIFLKVLVKGDRVSLFSYEDHLKPRFFVADKFDTEPKELGYRVYYNVESSTGGRTVHENIYKNQLFSTISKFNLTDERLVQDIQQADYTKAYLEKIINEINGNSNKGYQKRPASDYGNRAQLTFFISASANITTTQPSGPYQNAGGKSYTSYLPSASAGIDFYANPNTRKLVFRAELMLGLNQYKSAYTNKVSPYVPILYSYTQTAIAITPQIIYNFYNAENFKVYGGFGLALTYNSYSSANFSSQDGKTPVSQIIQNDPYNFYKFNYPAIFKAGVKFSKHVGVFADYINKAQASHDGYFQMQYSTLKVGLDFSL